MYYGVGTAPPHSHLNTEWTLIPGFTVHSALANKTQVHSDGEILTASSRQWQEKRKIEISDITWTECDAMEMQEDGGFASNLLKQGSKLQQRSRSVRAVAKYCTIRNGSRNADTVFLKAPCAVN